MEIPTDYWKTVSPKTTHRISMRNISNYYKISPDPILLASKLIWPHFCPLIWICLKVWSSLEVSLAQYLAPSLPSIQMYISACQMIIYDNVIFLWYFINHSILIYILRYDHFDIIQWLWNYSNEHLHFEYICNNDLEQLFHDFLRETRKENMYLGESFLKKVRFILMLL